MYLSGLYSHFHFSSHILSYEIARIDRQSKINYDLQLSKITQGKVVPYPVEVAEDWQWADDSHVHLFYGHSEGP